MRLFRSPLIAVCALSLLAGWGAGYWMRPAAESSRAPAAAHDPYTSASTTTGDQDANQTPDTPHGGTATPADFDGMLANAAATHDELDRRLRFREFARAVALEDMEAALDSITKLSSKVRWDACGALGTHWGQTAPQAALQRAIAKKPGRLPEFLCSSILAHWVAQAPDAAAAWVAKIPPGKGYDKFSETLLMAVAEHAPERIMDFIRVGKISETDSYAVRNAFENWAERDVQGAIAAAMQLPHTHDMRSKALNEIGEAWAERDGASAFAWAQGMKDEKVRGKLLGLIVAKWAGKDPAEAFGRAILPRNRGPEADDHVLFSAVLTWVDQDPETAQAAVLALPVGRTRDEAMDALGYVLGQDHPNAGMALLSRLSAGREKTKLTEDMLRGLALHDPAAAVTFLASMPPGTQHRELTGRLASNWASYDPDGAVAWAKQLPRGPDRDSAFLSVSEAWARADPQAAVDFLSKEDPSGSRDYGLDTALRIWTASAPSEALAWALSRPADHGRDPLILNIIGEFQKTDPPQAAHLFATQLTAATDGNVAGQIADAWAGEDPQAAVQWAAGLPDETVRGQALGGAIGTWAGRDPATAARYVQGLTAGPARDAAVENLSNAIWSVDHEGAIAWMATLGDPGQRVGRLNGFVTGWMEEDPTAARSWLDRTTLFDAADKRRFLYRFAHPDGPDDALR